MEKAKEGFDAMTAEQKMRFLRAVPRIPMTAAEKGLRFFLWVFTGALLMLGAAFWAGVCFRIFRWIVEG